MYICQLGIQSMYLNYFPWQKVDLHSHILWVVKDHCLAEILDTNSHVLYLRGRFYQIPHDIELPRSAVDGVFSLKG